MFISNIIKEECEVTQWDVRYPVPLLFKGFGLGFNYLAYTPSPLWRLLFLQTPNHYGFWLFLRIKIQISFLLRKDIGKASRFMSGRPSRVVGSVVSGSLDSVDLATCLWSSRESWGSGFVSNNRVNEGVTFPGPSRNVLYGTRKSQRNTRVHSGFRLNFMRKSFDKSFSKSSEKGGDRVLVVSTTFHCPLLFF